MKTGFPLCEIYCENDQKFTINGLFHGQIIEFNESIIRNPDILKEHVI